MQKTLNFKGSQKQEVKNSKAVTTNQPENRNKKNLQDQLNEIINNIQSSNIVKPTNVEAQRILKILDELVYLSLENIK